MNLRAWREKRRVSLAHLAAETGLMSDYLSKIEEGSVAPSEAEQKRIEKAQRKIEGGLPSDEC